MQSELSNNFFHCIDKVTLNLDGHYIGVERGRGISIDESWAKTRIKKECNTLIEEVRQLVVEGQDFYFKKYIS